jgi:murein DD-endopeptidase MepM/ murein hydrolase activator NlpD
MILQLLHTLGAEAAELLDFPIRNLPAPRIDLSIQNIRQTGPKIYEKDVLTRFVAERHAATQSPVVWGGYLEQRLIYASSGLFHQEKHPRNIHLGIDFYADAGTGVYAPLAGTVHSFQDNAALGDYGPTAIVQHVASGITFHTLYGHLSRASLAGLVVGQAVPKGHRIGWLGVPAENGEWPPHLHFQIILDMEGRHGDYPGVCAVEDLRHYVPNCPDPRFLLGI